MLIQVENTKLFRFGRRSRRLAHNSQKHHGFEFEVHLQNIQDKHLKARYFRSFLHSCVRGKKIISFDCENYPIKPNNRLQLTFYLLCRYFQKDLTVFALPAGFLAGASYLIEPNLSINLSAFINLMQVRKKI